MSALSVKYIIHNSYLIYLSNFTLWFFSAWYLREPARKAFVTGFNWETTSIFTPSCFLLFSTVFLLSYSCICARFTEFLVLSSSYFCFIGIQDPGPGPGGWELSPSRWPSCTRSRALRWWEAPSRGSRRSGRAFSVLTRVLIFCGTPQAQPGY